MASKQSQGIETLLNAEKEAAKIVQQARQFRVQRLKDARNEAAKEIEAYKKQKEDEFKEYEAKHSNTTSTSQSKTDEDTSAKLESIEKSFAQNKEGVMKKILDRVVKIEPSLHRNLKKVES